ncbi:MAG: hypothetical protein MUD11_10125 [Rhodobacteraceae bacterium]|jgi:hypothetical protein|nr:hypothetical protein [Paracoccaceae bacterium]
MIRILGHAALILLLTLLTQTGGIAWAAALFFRRRLMVFAIGYTALWAAAYSLSPRTPLPCFGAPLRLQSALYCALNRHYVTPELASVAADAARQMAASHPGTITLALDGSFPFLNGMPMIPHLSHDDGEKLDLAFYYTDAQGAYLPGKTRSPLGYFAFEMMPPEACPQNMLTLRWNLGWLQPLLPDRPLDGQRTAALIRHLAADARVGKVFVEPPLAASLGLSDPKIRFQGCRAARHDDHIHFQL